MVWPDGFAVGDDCLSATSFGLCHIGHSAKRALSTKNRATMGVVAGLSRRHRPTRDPMFGSSTTVKLEKDLFDRLKRCSEAAGYSSVDEFVQHVLEKELSKIEEGESDEEILKKLQGLGYIE